MNDFFTILFHKNLNYFLEGPAPMQSHCPTETSMFLSKATFIKNAFFIGRPSVFDSRPMWTFKSAIVFARKVGKTRSWARSRSRCLNRKATTEQISEISDSNQMQQQQLNGNLPSAIFLYWCHMFQSREMLVQEGNECPVYIINW